ncbi:hypothetical protein O6H91_02G008000 [Diphasiastrum complanatum]|uniref:Uncharacterized protein n=1 Tax=Diphasiastrum complanatum TaxID=34168 RepID=A0ACC2ECD6_DIPCM|nr:hypothetical protein O6H91_02G008000 [Diphasiastrum complanatum]
MASQLVPNKSFMFREMMMMMMISMREALAFACSGRYAGILRIHTDMGRAAGAAVCVCTHQQRPQDAASHLLLPRQRCSAAPASRSSDNINRCTGLLWMADAKVAEAVY